MLPYGMTLASSDPTRPPRWSVERRMALVLARLQWEGRVNRSDLVARFGISPNQATADLRRFAELYPGALAYDAKEKTYRAGPDLPAPAQEAAEQVLRDLRLVAEGVLPGDEVTLASVPTLAAAGAPSRPAAPAVLQAVLAAIRMRAVLHAIYQSFSAPESRPRQLEPHALVFDGFRWHARSRDAEDGAYKDFVLGRLFDPWADAPGTAEPVRDTEWDALVDLELRPHPDLPLSQRLAVEADYAMTDGRVLLTCRRAVSCYTKRRLGLTAGHEARPAHEQHVVLHAELDRVNSANLAMSVEVLPVLAG